MPAIPGAAASVWWPEPADLAYDRLVHRLPYLVTLLALAGCLRTGSGRVDQRVPDGPQWDMVPIDLAAVPDTTQPDTVSPPDMVSVDAPPACALVPDPATLLLYTFEGSGSTVIDVTGKHNGTIVGSSVTRSPGPPGCGNAVAFPNAVTDYVLIPDAPDWDLSEGSVDFWVRIDTASPSTVRGIVSRDADAHVQPGHLTVYQLCDGGLAVRLQHQSDTREVRCSPPVKLGVWHHVGVNFGQGGLALYVNGVAATRTDTISNCFLTLECGTSSEQGMEGNDNPWALGVSTHNSAEGQVTPTKFPFDGAIDSFRVSSARRPFGAGP